MFWLPLSILGMGQEHLKARMHSIFYSMELPSFLTYSTMRSPAVAFRNTSRQQALIESVAGHLGGLLKVQPEAGGMHLTARLGAQIAMRMSDVDVSRKAREAGFVLPALSDYCAGSGHHQGLLMGYSGFDEVELDAACEKLAAILQAS